MLNELINIHRQITELITVEIAFQVAFIWLIILEALRVKKIIIEKQVIFNKNIKRNLLVIIRAISIFITKLITSTILLLGFYSEKILNINIVKLLVVCILLRIIRRVTNSVIMKGDIEYGDAR